MHGMLSGTSCKHVNSSLRNPNAAEPSMSNSSDNPGGQPTFTSNTKSSETNILANVMPHN